MAITAAIPQPAVDHNEFITVPEITLPGGLFVPAFLAGKYVCSKSDTGLPVVTADGKPWVGINHHETLEVIKQAGFDPMFESRHLSIAYQATLADENWTGGKVGEGELVRGLHLWTVNGPQDGHYESDKPIERRWLVLPNGEKIYDVAGNVWQRIFDDIQGDENGIINRPFADDSPTKTTPPYESGTHGIGSSWVGKDWSGLALVRGGCWDSHGGAGVFCVGYDLPSGRRGFVGFRVTKSL